MNNDRAAMVGECPVTRARGGFPKLVTWNFGYVTAAVAAVDCGSTVAPRRAAVPQSCPLYKDCGLLRRLERKEPNCGNTNRI